jgi:hypothetical protein
MKLLNNLARPLETNTYTIFIKGTAEIYFTTDELSDFILDSTLTDTTGTFIAKQGMKIKAVFTTGEVVLI